MPIKKSAAKALRQSKKREERNKVHKAGIDWLKRQLTKSLADKNKDKSADFYHKIQKAFDKAVQKGALKKNTAARKKSRLNKKLNSLVK